MGASPEGTSTSPRTVDSMAQNAEAGATMPRNDYVRQIRDTAIAKLGSNVGLRMAGDKLSDLQPTTSMAEESAAVKYSPEKTSKAPGSQYLAYSSSPARVTGA